MVKRKIINIDKEKCNGCGVCIPNCPEGAIQIIDGKARLISDIFCDGLGACIGHCPFWTIWNTYSTSIAFIFININCFSFHHTIYLCN